MKAKPNSRKLAIHQNHREHHDRKIDFQKTEHKPIKLVSDKSAHYDIDGVSYSPDGVVVASDALGPQWKNFSFISFVKKLFFGKKKRRSHTHHR